jgi:hypothetical protein
MTKQCCFDIAGHSYIRLGFFIHDLIKGFIGNLFLLFKALVFPKL